MSAASDYANGRKVGRMAATGQVSTQWPTPCWWLGYLTAWTEWWWRPWMIP